MPRTTTKRELAPLSFVEPMECKPVKILPTGAEWMYELKLDGYRCQAIKDAGAFRLLSRTGRNLTQKFPAVAAAVDSALPIGTAVDGELVAFDEGGNPSFNAIQNAGSGTYVMFFAFDLLTLAGKDVTREPLVTRRRLLEGVYKISELADISVQFPAEINFLDSVRKVNGEGVVAKKLTSSYQPATRSGAWMKMRLNLAQEFVIGGYTRGVDPFDALLLGFYRPVVRSRLPESQRQYVQPPQELVFCASVRNGFVPASRRSIFKELGPLETSVCPFVNVPETSAGRFGQGLTRAKMKECVWLRPDAVAQFEFLEWTTAQHLRHAHFVGMRDDKDASKVVRET